MQHDLSNVHSSIGFKRKHYQKTTIRMIVDRRHFPGYFPITTKLCQTMYPALIWIRFAGKSRNNEYENRTRQLGICVILHGLDPCASTSKGVESHRRNGG